MSNISPNVGENSPELTEKLKAANTPAEMSEILRQWYVDRGAERDRFSPDKILFDNFNAPDAAVSGPFSREIMIHGVAKVVVSDSELGLERAVGKAYQEAAAADAGTQPRGADGKFTSRRELGVAEKTELDLRFRRGELTAPEYLKASGELEAAFDTYAKEKLGLDPETTMHKNWASATEAFLNSPDGADWPGGTANQEIAARLLAENNLTDQPSAETFARVYAHMKEHNLVQPNPELVKREEDRFKSATSAEEINSLARAALGMPPRNSNLWGK
jgi:hypothetical protein